MHCSVTFRKFAALPLYNSDPQSDSIWLAFKPPWMIFIVLEHIDTIFTFQVFDSNFLTDLTSFYMILPWNFFMARN